MQKKTKKQNCTKSVHLKKKSNNSLFVLSSLFTVCVRCLSQLCAAITFRQLYSEPNNGASMDESSLPSQPPQITFYISSALV